MNRTPSPDLQGIISDRDIFIAVVSNIFGVMTLTVPRLIAESTLSSDGWMSVFLGGLIASLCGWIVAKIASSFPNQTFLSYASYLLSKPVAVVMTLIFSIQYIVVTAYNVREIAVLSHQYLFDYTPQEVVSLAFLLVVIYAVCGSQAAIFRLNVLFFPILISGLLIVILLPIGIIQWEGLLPFFQTDFKGYVQSTYYSIVNMLGFGIVLFYIGLVQKPQKTAKLTAIGVMVTMMFNVAIYIVCIGVFGNATIQNMFFPTFDLSRSAEIPGGFFERFDAFLFLFWTIIFFTTAMMAFDIAVMTIRMVFRKFKKINLVLILSPIIFLISMLPETYLDIVYFNKLLGHFMFSYFVIVTLMLGIAFKIKGGKSSG
ncbi:endospore germination permease [Ureibacillus sp. FSL K6-8385]|uniref:GerAB/ArcD/ProY family transporter n=1 Tax=Ureibacillus sp. FSL K6-8385 TaxID=2954684 RepID=UPI00315881B4